jgi:hypothetical protein
LEDDAEEKAGHPVPGSFEALYPNLTAWVQDGWVEIGRDDHSTSFVRAGDIGGMIWEGDVTYPSLSAALEALDAGIASWFADHG